MAIFLSGNILHFLLTTLFRFREVSNLLYTQNIFEFNHPMSLILFKKTIQPSSMNSIKSISINLQKDLIDTLRPSQEYKLIRDWQDMWVTISEMEGLEEIRVRLQFPSKTIFPWPETTILGPLWKLSKPMRVFEVDTRPSVHRDFEQTGEAPFKLLRNRV